MIRKLVGAAAVALGLIAFGSIGPAPASALCPYSYQDSLWETYYGDEDRQSTSTCDGDGFYAGMVRENSDSNNDGQPAVIKVKVGSSWIVMQSASTTSWRNFNAQGVYQIKLCRGNTATCWENSLVGH